VWNQNCAIVHDLAQSEFEPSRNVDSKGSRDEIVQEACGSTLKAIAFVLNVIRSREVTKWRDILEEYPVIARKIWDDAVGDRTLVFISQENRERQFITKCLSYSRDGVTEIGDIEELPLPTAFVMRIE
jgi:hypothetical protein